MLRLGDLSIITGVLFSLLLALALLVLGR